MGWQKAILAKNPTWRLTRGEGPTKYEKIQNIVVQNLKSQPQNSEKDVKFWVFINFGMFNGRTDFNFYRSKRL